MKKMVAGLIAAAVFAGIAQAQSTYSQNAVGFINMTDLKANQLYAVNIPFENMNGTESWVFTDTDLAKDAPGGSSVFFWSAEKQGWDAYSKNKLTKKWNTGDRTVELGEFFFFQPGADMASCVLAGEVPDDVIPVPVAGKENISGVGLPYPVEMTFTDTDLAKEATGGSSVFFWSAEKQGWDAYSKNKLTKKWNSGDRKVQPGEGFFFQGVAADSDTQWSESVPYDWPNVSKE